MKEYECSVPVMGVAHVTVFAESPEAALKEAIEIASCEEVDEWQTYAVLVQGNVFYGRQNKAQIDNVYEPNDE